METNTKNYLTITAGYWAFTLTDGAIRMLVVLYFHLLGYSAFEVAMLFLFYEFFGIITNLVGGWLGVKLGLNVTMHIGMALQVIALLMLTVSDSMLSVAYVMFAQALSGIAKDLNKMSAKAGVKTVLGKAKEHSNQNKSDKSTNQDSKLFKWVAILTGSKNALKGIGYFLGAFLLDVAGFRLSLFILAGSLFIVLIITLLLIPKELGKNKTNAKPKFTQVFSNTSAINWLSATRFFLFGSRDVWFVVALPVFLVEILNWNYTQVGTFMALWIIGYGVVQALAPKLLSRTNTPTGFTAKILAFILALIPAAIAIALMQNANLKTSVNLENVELILISGLFIFAIVFAINSAVHSYLILAYADHDKVAMNVGFYYMANAAGRLTGTVLSGLIYQNHGLIGCLWVSAGFLIVTGGLSFMLPKHLKNTV